MRVFTDGAETGDMTFFTGTTDAGAAVDSGTYASGVYSYRFGYDDNEWKTISPLGELYYRGRVLVHSYDASINFIAFRASTSAMVSIGVDAIARPVIRLYGAVVSTGTNALVINTWYLIEVYLKLDNSGRITLRIEGNEICDYSGDTNNWGTTVDNLYWSTPAGANDRMHIDDLALNDTTGAYDNSWCGDGRIVKLMASGSGTLNEFSNNGGVSASANYLYVDEYVQDGDTTYVFCSGSIASIKKDQYKISPFTVTGANIKRIFPMGTIKKTQGSDNYFKLGYLPAGGTVQLSGSVPATLSYITYSGTSALTNPVTGLPWTNSEVSNLEYVIEKE
jgi:hypothetical protein